MGCAVWLQKTGAFSQIRPSTKAYAGEMPALIAYRAAVLAKVSEQPEDAVLHRPKEAAHLQP